MTYEYKATVKLRPESYEQLRDKVVRECKAYFAKERVYPESIIMDIHTYWKLFIENKDFKAVYYMGDIKRHIRNFFLDNYMPSPKDIRPIETMQYFLILQRDHPFDILKDAKHHYEVEQREIYERLNEHIPTLKIDRKV